MQIRELIKYLPINVTGYKNITGGDINQAYCLEDGDKKYFIKLNSSSRFPGMFEKEARGLIALRENSHINVPEVIQCGEVNGQQYLLLEWLYEKEKQGAMNVFGNSLAEMHREPRPFFGWEEDNYIGSLPQQNPAAKSWPVFYGESRIMPLVITLRDKRILDDNEVKHAEKLCNGLGELFPEEPAALLHGDLWSGNYMVTCKGVCLFDPAVYYGHREMDIGMTKLFGGFSDEFYKAYDDVYPLQPGWMDRLDLTQLYPLLVHSVLFQGGYIERVKEIIKRRS